METILSPHSLFNLKPSLHHNPISHTLTTTKPISCNLKKHSNFQSFCYNLKKDSIFQSFLPFKTNPSWGSHVKHGLAALAVSLALSFTPMLGTGSAFASEFDVLNDGPPKETYVVDDAGVLSLVTRSDLKKLLGDLEYRKKIRIDFVTVRKLTVSAHQVFDIMSNRRKMSLVF